MPLLEFNLSQFAGPDELIGAFHQVRDEALRGLTPFVFWDEFDSKEYMWLQYLLAPMQDGAFREGQISHPIGKCVFVFAGGTSFTMENFGPTNSNSEEFRKFKLLKGPDFVSRLSGYLNVLGPNRRQKYDTRSGTWENENNPFDTCFPIRRALLIRAVLGFSKDAQMEIDRGLLNALLEVGQYKHGARSLETILMLSKGQRKEGLKRSYLPPKEQIYLHLDYDEFLSLVNRDLPFKMNSEVLAPAVHECYRSSCKSRGETVKYDCDFSDLPDDIKASNIAAAARIPEVLSSAGLLIVPENHPETLSRSRLNKIIEDNIEVLAEAEHDGWMEQKYRDGWVYGFPRNDAMKIHDALISYKDLSENNKTKDRDAVRNYPGIVKMAGFKICRMK